MSKVLFALSVIGAFLVAGGVYNTMSDNSAPTEIVAAYNIWKQSQGKLYGSSAEDSYRMTIFADNYAKVQEHNAKGLSWTIGMNKFADLTIEEFRKNFLGFSKTNRRVTTTTNFKRATAASVDWTTTQAVTPVKDQGQCGSCWSFSATGGMEGAYWQKTGNQVSFSEQQLVDCATAEGNEGCNGGLPEWAYTYVESHGIMRESDYGYTGQDGTCQFNASKVVDTVTSYAQVAQADNLALKDAVAQQPISIGYNAGNFSFQLYTSGIYAPRNCPADLDHGILIVGYGTQDGDMFWKIKNSWGLGWGMNGYFLSARSEQEGVIGLCGVTEDATTVSFA